jgi:serine/threonine protein kinase
MADSAGARPNNVPSDIRGGLPAGTTLHSYELKSILGKGAFGITYRARDITLNRDVAIKEYLPATLALREGRTTVLPVSTDHAEPFAWGRERFLEEARTLAQLDRTPAIVRVHEFFEANGTAYMVMALIEGETRKSGRAGCSASILSSSRARRRPATRRKCRAPRTWPTGPAARCKSADHDCADTDQRIASANVRKYHELPGCRQ